MAAVTVPVSARGRPSAPAWKTTLAAFACACACTCAAASADAHTVSAAAGAARAFGWTFDAEVVALLELSLAAYAIGFFRLYRRSRLGRTQRRLRAGAFVLGWLALAAVFVSPLDALTEALFSAHMVQHEAMMLVAAPLMVIGRPLGVWAWALPRRVRAALGGILQAPAWRAVWSTLVAPLPAWGLHAAALWAWHLPTLFEAALVHPVLHTLQHACFLLTALLFWWGILETRTPGAARAGSAHAMFSLFTTMVHTSALGALLTLAPGLWYPFYIEPCNLLGMDPLKDQQLGGLIMWVPAALAYLLAALAVAARWLARGQDGTVPVIVAVTRTSAERTAAVGDETI